MHSSTELNVSKEATPANAPILYQYGAFGQRLGKIRQCRSTIQNIVVQLYHLVILGFMK